MTKLLIALLCVAPACIPTVMTARHARVPVLVGPVPCIGCATAGGPTGPATPITDGASRWRGAVILPWGETQMGAAHAPRLAFIGESAGADTCQGDIRITRIKAKSFGVIAILYSGTEESVNVEGVIVPAANGNCGPRPWPYSGPQGIVVFEPPPAPGPAAAQGSPP